MPEADAVLTKWPVALLHQQRQEDAVAAHRAEHVEIEHARHSSTGMASGRPATITPTLFTTTSMRPNSASTRSRAASNSASRATSQRCTHAERPRGRDLAGDDVGALFVDIGHEDPGPAPGELTGDGAPDAAAGAGDERGGAVEIERGEVGHPVTVPATRVRCPRGTRRRGRTA